MRLGGLKSGDYPAALIDPSDGQIVRFSAGYLDWQPPDDVDARCQLCLVRAASIGDRCLECWLILDQFDEYGVTSREALRLDKIRRRALRESADR